MNENYVEGNIKLKNGWVNIHIDLETNRLFCSQKPYASKEEAEKGVFIGGSIYKLGTYEICYPDYFVKKAII